MPCVRLRSRAESYSSCGVRSSMYSFTSFAPTRFSRGASTFKVLAMPSLRRVTTSPGASIRDGFTFFSSIFTLPALQAVVACVRVLNTRVAHNHLSTRQFSTTLACFKPYRFCGALFPTSFPRVSLFFDAEVSFVAFCLEVFSLLDSLPDFFFLLLESFLDIAIHEF